MREISNAVILMAGTGSRLRATGEMLHKTLIPISGRPLFSYIIGALEKVGVTTLHVVVGWESERLLAGLAPLVPASLRLHPIENREWQKQNGISLLRAAAHLTGPFLLLMGDHLLEPRLLTAFVKKADPGLLNLAVDRKIKSIFDLDDAMKVETNEERVVAIGKTLAHYDAIDTGIFVCPLEIFSYLARARKECDCSLADGVRLMASDGKVRAVDVGRSWWQDVDTAEMRGRAEKEIGKRAAFKSKPPFVGA